MSQTFSEEFKNRLQWSLFSLRLGVFIVLIMWVMDKFLNPAHGAAVFNAFYGISGVGESIFTILGILQLILIFNDF